MPSPADRLAIRDLAARILAADSETPLGLDRSEPADHAHGRCVRRPDVEQLLSQFAAEVVALEQELVGANRLTDALMRIACVTGSPEERAAECQAIARNLVDWRPF